MSSSAAGIKVAYPAGLNELLVAQVGATAEEVEEALAVLNANGLMRRSGKVIWVVSQLADDPHLVPHNPKHRTMIQRYVSALPRHPLVAQFIRAQRAWFEDGTGALTQDFAWAALPVQGCPSEINHSSISAACS